MLAGLLNAGCSSPKPHISATDLLHRAKAKLDATPALHFKLTSSNVAHSATNITGGEGDMARPNALRGTFDVVIRGFVATVKVASAGGVFEAELPFSGRYTKTDPSKFGLTDPAQLMDPDKGLTRLLTLSHDPHLGPSQRIAGELVDTITYTVPGSAIPVLPDYDPAKPVTMTAAINPSTFELRAVTLVGPLTSPTADSTYVLTLTAFGERVAITLPAAS